MNRHEMHTGLWSAEEETGLADAMNRGLSWAEAGRELGRTPGACRCRWQRMQKLRKSPAPKRLRMAARPWTAEDDALLRQIWGRMDEADAAAKLMRTPNAIQQRASAIGLTQKPVHRQGKRIGEEAGKTAAAGSRTEGNAGQKVSVPAPRPMVPTEPGAWWRSDEDMKIRRFWGVLPPAEIAGMLGRSVDEVVARARLAAPPDFCESTIRRRRRGGESSGAPWLGVLDSDAAICL